MIVNLYSADRQLCSTAVPRCAGDASTIVEQDSYSRHHITILDTQGLQSPASRTGVSSPYSKN
jgi:hypothetical protein